MTVMKMRNPATVTVAALVVLAASTSSSAASHKPRVCKRHDGFATLIAYNMSCAQAKRYFRREPAGWSGANGDVILGHGLQNGIAMIFRNDDMDTVLNAMQGRRYRRPDIRSLYGVPAVWAAVAYGE